MAILSLVGKRMRNMVGIAGRMFTTLGDGKVNIEMISQGANEINISCVIDARDAIKALNLIHQSCLQIRPDGARGRSESEPSYAPLLSQVLIGVVCSGSLVILKHRRNRTRDRCELCTK